MAKPKLPQLNRRSFARSICSTLRILAVFSVLLNTQQARAQGLMTWGLEAWQCGDQWFDIQLGEGGDVLLDRLDGDVSATSGSSSQPARRWVRESLISILPYGPTPFVDGRTLAKPNPGNHSVAGNLVDLIVKQRGDESINMPVHQVFDPPVRLKDGRLRALFDTRTYSADAAMNERMARTHPEECLDVELQLAVSFRHVAKPIGAKPIDAKPIDDRPRP